MKSFLILSPQECRVTRNGTIQEINARELVRGDVVSIKYGDRIPADLRLFEAVEMKVGR